MNGAASMVTSNSQSSGEEDHPKQDGNPVMGMWHKRGSNSERRGGVMSEHSLGKARPALNLITENLRDLQRSKYFYMPRKVPAFQGDYLSSQLASQTPSIPTGKWAPEP